MTRLALLLVGIALVVSACGGAEASPPTTQPAPPKADRSAEIYAAVVKQLVTKDHTFGSAESPFDHVYVIDGAVNDAGERTPFGPGVHEEIARSLGELPVEFVRDADSVIENADSCAEVKGEGVLITLHPIDGDGDRVEVANELFFACLGAQGLTYIVKHVDGQWQVTGTTGPISVA